ncbi:ankyrin repeat domain-containing protein 61-like [Aulostomus maculatus]
MLVVDKESKGRSSTTPHNDQLFYKAVMDEDLECIDDMSRRYGSNYPIGIKDGGPEKLFWMDSVILPLHLAASYRRVQSMQRLLSAGANPEIRDRLGRTTLHLLVSSWPSLSTSTNEGTRFQTAVADAHRKAETCLWLLCENGINVSAQVEDGSQQTALHLAISNAALAAIKLLIKYGADVNAVDSSGMMPLHMAAGILNKDIIVCLIRHGADINMRVRHSGNTPLHIAVVAMAIKTTKLRENDICSICQLLMHGAEPDAMNKAGRTPLQEACSMGNEEIVDLLVKNGANINKLSKSGESSLFLFLKQRYNVRNRSLLVKLLNLTSPLTVYNKRGHLPSTLKLPCFSKQRDQILKLTQQPRSLQEICKIEIYVKYIKGKKERLREILPKRLYDFVFHFWENTHISFEADDDQEGFDIIPF